MKRGKPYSSPSSRPYWHEQLPKTIVTEKGATEALERIRVLARQLRRDLYLFQSREGYRKRGYPSMPACVKSEIPELTPHIVGRLYSASCIEREMALESEIGTLPYEALLALKKYAAEARPRIWNKAVKDTPNGGNPVTAITAYTEAQAPIGASKAKNQSRKRRNGRFRRGGRRPMARNRR